MLMSKECHFIMWMEFFGWTRGLSWGKFHALNARPQWLCGILRAVNAAGRSRCATRPDTLSRRIGHHDAWERSPMDSATGPFPPHALLQVAVTEAIRVPTLGTDVALKFQVSPRARCTAAEKACAGTPVESAMKLSLLVNSYRYPVQWRKPRPLLLIRGAYGRRDLRKGL